MHSSRLIFAVVMLASASLAQTAHGVPSSVTSSGFGHGGSAPRGLAPSVGSVNFGGVPSANRSGHGVGTGSSHRSYNPPYNANRRNNYGYGGVYGVPYFYPYVSDDVDSGSPDDDEYDGGPTIFDRRGPGTPVAQDSEPAYSDMTAQNSRPGRDETPSDQPDTVLIFKDGHSLEIENYAIVGPTLYDLSSGQHHKIALADLDLAATAKQNDERGVDFQVPNSVQAN